MTTPAEKQAIKRTTWSPVDDSHGLAYDQDRNRITFRIKIDGRWFNVAHLYVVDPTRFLEFLKDNLPQALVNLFKKDPVQDHVEKLLAEWQLDQTISSRDLWERFKELATPVMETLLEKDWVEIERSEFDPQGNLVVHYKRRQTGGG